VTPEAAATVHGPGVAKPLVAPAEATKGTWSVQVNATKEGELARSLVRRLRERGYDAFIVEQSREGATWYRVRVGRLQSIEMANQLVSKIKEREGLPHAFVASD
jgi:cell division septation protein DedD